MIKKVTREWLESWNACGSGIRWFERQDEVKPIALLKLLIKEKNYSDAKVCIVKLFTHKQSVQYAVFAAEQAVGIFEKDYPKDKRPRLAIEAAKKCIKRNTKKNRAAAADAAAAAYAAYAAYAAANAAAYAAYAADAANAAANAAAMRIKILNYGIKLLEVK